MTTDTGIWRRRVEEELAQNAAALAEARSAAGTVTLDQASVGRLSRMDAMQQQAMARGLIERLETRKRKLDAALARIEAGTFGLCCECGAEVEAERLDGDPAAVFCRECMNRREPV